MRILFYCDEYPPAPHGGIGRVTQIVAEALAVKGHYVVAAGYNALFQSDKASISPQTEILQNGVHTYRLVSNRLYSNRLVIWKSLLTVSQIINFSFLTKWVRFLIAKQKLRLTEQWIAQIIDQQKIDVLEIIDYQDAIRHDLTYPITFRRFQVPTVMRVHGSCSFIYHFGDGTIPTNIFMNDRNSFQRVDAICAVSGFSAQFVTESLHPSVPVEVIYNPVEMKLFDHLKPYPEPIRILFFGKISRTKGTFTLIHAFNKLASIQPMLELHLNGYGELETAEKMIDPLNKNRVIIKSFMSQEALMVEIDQAYLCALPSYFENFSMAALEVMARRRALLYSTRSSGPELIVDGETGWLADPENIEELVAKIDWALRNRDATIVVAQRGFDHCFTHFSTDKIIPQLEKFYEQLIQESIHQ
jgi:glycosyltransferase involved in cell wall biosynthesis